MPIYKLFFLGVFLCCRISGVTQSASVTMGAPMSQSAHQVQASDGVYDKFVLVRWEEVAGSTGYRLFRANSASGASMQELTKSWQKSTWFCDYSAERGKDYFYAVMANVNGKSSPLTAFDKGYKRKEESFATEESLTATGGEKVAAGKQVFLLVSDVRVDSAAVTVGGPMRVQMKLENVFDQPTPGADVRWYLSQNNIWDFSDTLLSERTFSSFPAGAETVVSETLVLPEKILPGTYYILVVAAPDGQILHAKTGSVEITVTSKP